MKQMAPLTLMIRTWQSLLAELAFVVTKTKHTRGHPTQLVVVELITIILAFSQIRVLQRMLGLNLAIPILLVRDCSSEQITLRPHWACLVP